MAHGRLHPGVFFPAVAQLKKYKREAREDGWDIFHPAELTGFKATDVRRLLAVLTADDARAALHEVAMTLRELKNLHYSVQLALMCVEAEEELARTRERSKVGLRKEAAKEVAALQSTEALYTMILGEVGGDAKLVRANADTLRGQRPLRKALAAANDGETQSVTSVDSDLGQILGWSGMPLRTHSHAEPTFSGPLAGTWGSTPIDDGPQHNPPTEVVVPAEDCPCTPFTYTWNESVEHSWSYVLEIDYPCGVKWCHRRVWGHRIKYPCGVKKCTKEITFDFDVVLGLGFEMRVECTGILLLVEGHACVAVEIAGVELESCLEAYAIAGAGADIEVTVGVEEGQCFYGGTVAIGLFATIAGHEIWRGEIGYGLHLTLPCATQYNENCVQNKLAVQPVALPGYSLIDALRYSTTASATRRKLSGSTKTKARKKKRR